jgi:hypothetical protein
MKYNFASVIRGAILSTLLAGTALAGPLASDGNALPGWQGTQPFNGAIATNHLNATVDYAVYSPGAFGSSLALGLPAASDPSGGTEFVYAYEIFDTPASNVAVNALTVALDPGVISNLNHIGSAAIVPGVTPSPPPAFSLDAFLVPQSAAFTFNNPQIAVSGNSIILLFTSPFGPQNLSATLGGGHSVNAVALLPSPKVPEPASIVLAATALLSLLAIRASHIHRRNR